jgi:predicted component of type VI protein secretion system
VIELRILSGKQAGATVAARRFPFQVGRAPDSGLRLEDDGVFERHFRIVFKRGDGFLIASEPNAVTAINNRPATEARLRSGDTIQAGSVSIGFSLSPMRQHSLRVREAFVWAMLAMLCFAQVGIIYWLLDL